MLSDSFCLTSLARSTAYNVLVTADERQELGALDANASVETLKLSSIQKASEEYDLSMPEETSMPHLGTLNDVIRSMPSIVPAPDREGFATKTHLCAG